MASFTPDDDVSEYRPNGGLIVIPFGKYRGFSIEDVRQSDSEYLQWLLQQSWFKQKFSKIVEYVSSSLGSEIVVCNPAKNRLQNLFLQERFITEFVLNLVASCNSQNKILTNIISKFPLEECVANFVNNVAKSNCKKLKQHIVEDGAICRCELGWKQSNNNNKMFYGGYGLYERKVLDVVLRDKVECSICQFESTDGYEVTIDVTKCFMRGTYTYSGTGDANKLREWEQEYLLRNVDTVPGANIEGKWGVILRPLLGIDYPSLLRKTHDKSKDTNVVILVARYDREDVTSREELRKIFGHGGVRIVFLDEMSKEFFRYWQRDDSSS